MIVYEAVGSDLPQPDNQLSLVLVILSSSLWERADKFLPKWQLSMKSPSRIHTEKDQEGAMTQRGRSSASMCVWGCLTLRPIT